MTSMPSRLMNEWLILLRNPCDEKAWECLKNSWPPVCDVTILFPPALSVSDLLEGTVEFHFLSKQNLRPKNRKWSRELGVTQRSGPLHTECSKRYPEVVEQDELINPKQLKTCFLGQDVGPQLICWTMSGKRERERQKEETRDVLPFQ